MTRRPRCAAHSLVSLLAAGVLAACSGSRSDVAKTPADARQGAVTGRTAVAFSSSAGAACGVGDAHAKHLAAGFACVVCHACAGVLALGPTFTFPGGTSTANGTVVKDGTTTTCSVGCHAPLGAPLLPVTWNAGPLRCTSCHANVTTAQPGSVLSSHFGPLAAIDDSTCASCHDQSRHTQGQVWLRGADGSATPSASCRECHRGQGQTLGSATPPLLVGWDDTAQGDFHGDRAGTCRFEHLDATGTRTGAQGALACPANQPQPPGALRITSRWSAQGSGGTWAWTCDIEAIDGAGNPTAPTLLAQPCPPGTVLNSSCNAPPWTSQCYPTTLVTRGFGGTLLAPYARGQAALPCSACHDFHSSPNAFLVASTVNGTAIPPAAIDRAGVGAQVLCNACHAGDRHQICKDCHKQVWTTDGEYSWFEGDPVDPASDGSACFYCHGHEGLLHMRDPSPQWPGGGHPFNMAHGGGGDVSCSHCHSTWAPPSTEYAPPAFASWSGGDPAVSGVTATTATISWGTDEPATSYVEYGAGSPGFVAGDNQFVRVHSVSLVGLTPATTYVWRIRSSDVFRNVRISSLQAFVTPGAEDVPKPDLAPVGVSATVGTYATTTTLVWFPVTAPSGTAVEYEVQLASDPGFTSLVNGSIAGPGVPGLTVGDSGWVSGTPTTWGGKPALGYPAAITNIPQDQCVEIVPNVYYWRVRARDGAGHVSEWSAPGSFGAFAGDPWC